jgi:hypothetical protein
MALGAITQQNTQPGLSNTEPGAVNLGGMRVVRNSVVGDSSYPTGGSVLAPSSLGFGTEGVILWATVQLKASSGTNCSAVSARYDEVNGKLQCFSTTDAVGDPVSEAAATTNLSGLTWDIVAYGIPGA